MSNLVGRELGQYQILEELGRGGMAVVYKAYQPALDRHVAIKILPPQFTFDEEFVERFLREARAVAQLNHPHIVTIHDVGEIDSTYFIVMEYVECPSLSELLRQHGALSQEQTLNIVSQIASALDYAHQRGFVHRDVKPNNVLLGAEDEAKLTDFGIVRAQEGTRLTQTGTLLGTPEYMSPEQARGLEIDHRSDIYSLGVMVYEMLTGQAPFRGDTMAVLHAHVYEPPDLSVLPAAISAAISPALAKEPGQRYESAGALAEALGGSPARTAGGARAFEPPTRVVTQPGVVSRLGGLPVWLWGGGAAVLVITLVLAFTRNPQAEPASTLSPSRVPTTENTPTEMVTTDAVTTSTRHSPTAVPPTPTETPSPPFLRIAYVQGGVGNTDVYVANEDGHNAMCVACSGYDEAEPAWSPDGRYIVYQSDAGGTYDIWRVNSSGGTASQLTRTSSLDEREPECSPDGTRIAYRASSAGSDRNADGDLRIMDADGSDSYSLGIRGRSPVWSPDGQFLAYMSNLSGGWEVYVYSFQNNSSRRLTNCSANCRWPAWSPDGQYVIYHSTTSASSTSADTIWYVPLSGGSAMQLVTGYHAGRATWSRHDAIAFNSDRGIEVVRANGSGRRTLISNDQNWAPVWSE